MPKLKLPVPDLSVQAELVWEYNENKNKIRETIEKINKMRSELDTSFNDKAFRAKNRSI